MLTHEKHDWVLTIGRSTAQVHCTGCGEQFRPKPQQMKYTGQVPKESE